MVVEPGVPGCQDTTAQEDGGLLGQEVQAGQQLLTVRAPKAVPQVVTSSPVLGPALLGLDRVGPGEGAQGRLRAHYNR
ncbi:hypothetical protein ACFU3E_25810 [Streptomyces sp. NPDC057424]|uniref:hypothetical protein n=1 Tax=Streptomyces sp. NPDC057424 TaxID=3346127 RepID=UPI00368E535F